MGLFDKVSGFVKREAEDIGEVAERARDRLDQELSEREAELEMTPAEKLRALQRKARQNDDRVDEIMEKAGVSTAEADAAAEVQARAAAAADLEPPSVTQIVLADGSVRSGDDPSLDADGETDEDETPDEGDLSWVAPRQGEEAVVPAFSAAVGAASPSNQPDEAAGADDLADAAAVVDALPASQAPASETADHVEALPEPPVAEPVPVETSEPVAPEPEASELPPPPPPPLPEPVAPAAEPAPAEADASEPPRRETPAEIAARVVAELEQAVAEEPEPAPAPAAPAPKPEPTFEKTPAQRKYEEARRAADALLEELRGELRDDGEI